MSSFVSCKPLMPPSGALGSGGWSEREGGRAAAGGWAGKEAG
eukprot:CAMPEP_0170192732 /NCGR_PEP_ID=MMETSP0040_2-20121228/55077_1 /TAXON_ID=641309 /ORGANISM="Lotharella oceanica, Strain CCMP622" /LENGTH=41 /DNA_ID= /DNA_START= /DNA_END= /DNA_ORIENTATION=